MEPCSNCIRRNRTCVSSNDSDRCAEYVRRGVKCDQGGFDLSGFNAIQKEEERLEHEEEEAMAKILRLRKQRKSLKTHARELLRRGLRSLDELDEAEAKEKEGKEARERAAVNSDALAGSAWLEPLSDEQLDQLLLDFPEGTAELQPSY
jgi:transposase